MESRWDLTAHNTSRYIASKSYYSHHVRWNHQPIIAEKVPFSFIEQKGKEKPKLGTSQYLHSDRESLPNPNMWSSDPLNLLKTRFFGAKPWNLWQRLLKASPIKAKIPSFLVPSSTKQQGREWCSTPETHKKSGGSRPITPNSFGHKPKIGSKQSKTYYQPTEQILHAQRIFSFLR